MGFADYFLIVWDFIAFAKRNGIGVGPGRGSAAGSLVAYSLEITDIDPIKYDLLFERFLNPGRKSMPDIDIDFSVHGRDQVINYVSEKYGRDRVAQIITFGTMMARAAIRDAGRVLDVPYGSVDRIAKLVPEGPKVYLADCMKKGAELRQAYDGDELVRQIVDLATPLEGLVRQDSIHAAGVVIGDRPLTDVRAAPAEGRRPGGRDAVPDGRRRGARAPEDGLPRPPEPRRDRHRRRARGRARHHADPARRREDVRDARAAASRAGVFQFESSGMREALRQVKPTEFEDLIALVALYRPGPMGYIPVYAKRKAGTEQASFLDDRLRPITEPTYGDLHLPGAVHGDRQAARRLQPGRGGRSPEGDRQEDPLADGVPEGQVPRGVRGERRHAGGREPALEGHGAGAGLLLQQVARRLLRADRLPDRLPEGAPPGRVHGGAHLVRHEHEGPSAVLRRRLRRDGDRGAAARRERVDVGLRGRRRQDPVRAERGQERGGVGGARNRASARGGRRVRVGLGLRRASRRAARQQARARGARQVRGALRRPASRGRGCSTTSASCSTGSSGGG